MVVLVVSSGIGCRVVRSGGIIIGCDLFFSVLYLNPFPKRQFAVLGEETVAYSGGVPISTGFPNLNLPHNH